MRIIYTTASIIGLMILSALLVPQKYWKIILIIFFSVALCYLITKIVLSKKTKNSQKENKIARSYAVV